MEAKAELTMVGGTAYDEARRKLDERLVVDLWPEAGLLLGGLSRAATYRAAQAGTIPTIRVGRLYKVPCARLKRLVEADPQDAA